MNVDHVAYLEEAIASARPIALAQELEIFVCRGAERGCARPDHLKGPENPCPYCYRIDPNDLRSTEQIARDLERGDA